MDGMTGKKALVVGASRGIGLAVAAGFARAGMDVCLAARSMEKLEVAAKECGPSAFATRCDVRDEQGATEAIAGAVDRLGGLDVLVYSTGLSISRPIAQMRRDDWATVYETNVFGACTVTSVALSALEESKGHAFYLNSESALYEPSPWRGIGGYISSKRALDSIVRSFQLEHPSVAFTNYVVGATTTEFGSDSEDQSVMEYVPEWFEKGYVGTSILEPSDHAALILGIVGLPVRMHLDHVGARVRNCEL